jgi:predicted nucleotidyltransferase
VEAELADTRLRQAVHTLLEKKRSGAELDEGPRIPALNAFLEERIAYFQAIAAEAPRSRVPALGTLDAFFREALRETWETAPAE